MRNIVPALFVGLLLAGCGTYDKARLSVIDPLDVLMQSALHQYAGGDMVRVRQIGLVLSEIEGRVDGEQVVTIASAARYVMSHIEADCGRGADPKSHGCLRLAQARALFSVVDSVLPTTSVSITRGFKAGVLIDKAQHAIKLYTLASAF